MSGADLNISVEKVTGDRLELYRMMARAQEGLPSCGKGLEADNVQK